MTLLLFSQWIIMSCHKYCCDHMLHNTLGDGGGGGCADIADATADEYVKVMHTLVMCVRRRDLRRIATEVGISFGAVQSILTVILGMPKVSVRWVPRMLTDDHKKIRLNIYTYLLSRYEDDPSDLIERIVTQDETTPE